MSALPAARVGDEIAHTCAFSGALIGLGAGLLIGGAIAATVLTGGAGAPLIAMAVGGAIAAGGGGGMAGQYIGESIMGDPCGAIVEGSLDVFINDMPAARSTLSVVLCSKHCPPPQFEATGSSTVYINGEPAGRESEKTTCSAIIQKGSEDVFIGGESKQTLAMEPEVPRALSVTMQVMMWGGTALATGGVAAGYGLFAAAGSLIGGFGGGYLGSLGGGWAAEKLGYGETGQRVGEVLGGIGGGIFGGAKGFRGGQAVGNRVISNPRTANQAMLRGGTEFRNTFNARQKTAFDFYKSQGFDDARIPSHLDGIDFTKPVEVVPLNPGTKLTQYQGPGGSQGNYYAPRGTPASKLGIAADAMDSSGAIVPKTGNNYIVVGKNPTQALSSTAAPVKDTWSIKGQSIQTEGGGTQYFNTGKDNFILGD